MNTLFQTTFLKTIDQILQKIASLQSVGDAHFSAGLFPAFRSNKTIFYHRPDTTIFFSAIIAFTLQRLRPYLSPDNQEVVDNIVHKVQHNYPDFQNKDGLKTYNFWKTKPSQHFPNGYIFKHFDHFKIPDDVDDTAMIYLTTKPSEQELLWLKNKLSLHANLSKIKILNTYPEYKNLHAYSTWFGKNMYIEFDVCVLANLLYCIYEHKLPLNQNDTDSIDYIRQCIESDRYLTAPFRVAHQYPRTVAIVYHVSRLIGTFHISALAPLRTKIIEDTQKLLRQPQSFLDEVVLHISLMRLGVSDLKSLHIPDDVENQFDGFFFFIAGLLTAYQNPLLYNMASLPLFHIRWQCEAHCWALLAEYEVLAHCR